MTTTPQLSYNVQKSIIGHLSPEKRIQLSLCCPKLRNVEQKASFQLEILHIDKHFFQVDQVQFHFCKDFTRKVSLDKRSSYDWNSETKREDLMAKIMDLYLANRGIIKVRVLACEVLDFPKYLQVECQKLRLGDNQLEVIQSIPQILTNSFLEVLSIFLEEPDDPILQEELLQSAKYLKIHSIISSLVKKSKLTELRNPKILVSNPLGDVPEDGVIEVIENWLERCPQVGTQFTWNIRDYKFVLQIREMMKKKFGAVIGNISVRDIKSRRCAILRMRSGDELNVFGEKYKDQHFITLEVMNGGCAQAL